MDLFDTHFHLPDREDLSDYLDKLPPEHDFWLFTLGGSYNGSVRAVNFANANSKVWAGVGVHPHDAEEFDGNISPFEALAGNSSVRAIGEIGLDFFYDLSPRDLQIRCFERFLGLALKLDLPVCVHCRDQEGRFDAYEECYRMLKDFAAEAGDGKIDLHCYAGNLEYLDKFLSLGAYIGVTGMVTFKKSDNIRAVLKQIPRDRLLLETDSPYLAPVPYRGKENHPAYMVEIVRFAAGYLQVDPDGLAAQTRQNGARFFNIQADEM